MAYAGICGAQDLQPHSDDYFHTISFDEIVAYTNSGSGNTCPVTTNTGNSAPMPNAGSGGQTIPAQTPFTLTGSATDPDGDPLTYNWEEFDLGMAGAPNNPTNPPFFRSFNSTTGPSRTFPKWTDILSNTTTIGEVLPNTTRAMIFRLTVRDNRSGGGGVDRASTTINVTTAAGPFQVTAPNTALTWGTGSVQAVTWNVANTNLAPVNCSTVNVRLSIDGGFNYPIALASGVANNGSAAITVPNNPTTQARVQVACANNIFFDVSNVNFTIVAGTPDFSLTVNPTSQTICIPANAVYSVTAASVNGYTNPVNLSVSGIAAGATANWGMNPVTPTGATTLSIGNTGAFSVGSFPLTVTGQSGALSHSISSTLSILVGAPAQTTLIAPANNAMSQPLRPIFSWSALGQVGTYDIQIATDAGFTNVVAGATGLFTTTFTPGVDLDSGTIYYWRVRGANFCGAGIYSTVYMFTTQSQPTDCSLGMTTNVLYSTNFESGVGGWTHSGTGDTWSLWNTSVRSGTNAFHATDPASTSDQRLVSPPVVLPSGQNPVTLQFWNKQTLENRMGGCYDGGILEISSNGGVTWTQVMSDSLLTDPYDGSISTSFLNPLGGLNAWCGNPQDWLKSVVDVSAYAGQIVQFRFRLGSDSATGRPDGWNIDDVKVQSCLSSPQADLSLSKSVTPTTVLNGELVTYTLAITNGGPDTAANVVLSDVLPVSVTFRSLSAQPGWTCTTPAVGSAGLIKCTQPALPISSTVFTLVAQITGVHSISNTLITNQIIATADTLDPTLPNGASASVTVGGGAPQYQVYLPIVMRDF